MIVINAEKVVVGGRKSEQKKYYRHSQQPGGLKTEAFQDLQKVCLPQNLHRLLSNPMGCQSSRLHKACFWHLPVTMCVGAVPGSLNFTRRNENRDMLSS